MLFIKRINGLFLEFYLSHIIDRCDNVKAILIFCVAPTLRSRLLMQRKKHSLSIQFLCDVLHKWRMLRGVVAFSAEETFVAVWKVSHNCLIQ